MNIVLPKTSIQAVHSSFFHFFIFFFIFDQYFHFFFHFAYGNNLVHFIDDGRKLNEYNSISSNII